MIPSGFDPKQEQRLKCLELSNNSFEVLACKWIDKISNHWSEGHTHSVLTSLEQDVFPVTGGLFVNTFLQIEYYFKRASGFS